MNPGRRRPALESQPTRSSKPGKRRKLDKHSIAEQPIVTVIIEDGDASKSFNIHKHLLTNESEHLHTVLESHNVGTPIILRDVNLDTFESFARWIYDKCLVVEELEDAWDDEDEDEDDDEERDSNNGGDAREDGDITNVSEDTDACDGTDSVFGAEDDESSMSSPATANGNGNKDNSVEPWYYTSGLNRRGRVFGRLLELYKFATTYKIVKLRRAIILQWQRLSEAWETNPCPTVVNQALDSLSIESPLCKYLIIRYGRYADFDEIDKARIATLPSVFLTEVLILTFRQIGGITCEDKRLDEKWCEFHEHEDEAERKACEAGRKGDPDLYEPPPIRRFGGCC